MKTLILVAATASALSVIPGRQDLVTYASGHCPYLTWRTQALLDHSKPVAETEYYMALVQCANEWMASRSAPCEIKTLRNSSHPVQIIQCPAEEADK